MEATIVNIRDIQFKYVEPLLAGFSAAGYTAIMMWEAVKNLDHEALLNYLQNVVDNEVAKGNNVDLKAVRTAIVFSLKAKMSKEHQELYGEEMDTFCEEGGGLVLV